MFCLYDNRRITFARKAESGHNVYLPCSVRKLNLISYDMRMGFKLLSVVLLFVFGVVSVSFAQTNSKKHSGKKSKQEEKNEKFIAVKKLIESGTFVFTAVRAFPAGGQPVEFMSNPGQIVIQRDMAYAGLPYIGQSHTSMYGDTNVGMNFKGRMKDVKLKVNEKKRRIYFSFNVIKDDSFRVSMEISYDGGCSVTIISQRKTSISYSGTVSAYEGK